MSIQEIFGKRIHKLSAALRAALKVGFIDDEHPARLSCDDATIDRLITTYRTALPGYGTAGHSCVGVAAAHIEITNNTRTTCTVLVSLRIPYGIKEKPFIDAMPIACEKRTESLYNEYEYVYRVRPHERFRIDTSDILLHDAGSRISIVRPNIDGLLINVLSLDTSTMPDVTGKKRLLDRSVAMIQASVH